MIVHARTNDGKISDFINDITLEIIDFSAPLRVHPGSNRFLTELSDHQSDRGPAKEGQRIAVETFPVLGQTRAAPQPADGALDDPALGEHDEPAGVGPFDDLQVDRKRCREALGLLVASLCGIAYGRSHATDSAPI